MRKEGTNQYNDEQVNKLWDYIHSKDMQPNPKRNLFQAVAKGGRSAEQSVQSHLADWPITTLTPKKGGKGQLSTCHAPKTATVSSSTSTSPSTSTPTSARTSIKPAVAGIVRGKGSGNGSTTTWAELFLSEHSPVCDSEGKIAQKCCIRPNADEEEFHKAEGYILAHGDAAQKYIYHLAQRPSDAKPVVIIVPRLTHYALAAMKQQLADLEDKLNAEAGERVSTFGVSEVNLAFMDPKTQIVTGKDVWLTHPNFDDPLMPPQHEGESQIAADLAPELQCKPSDDVDISITIVKPMCDEVGQEEWAKKLFAITEKEALAREFKKLAGNGNTVNLPKPRVLQDRSIKFHGTVYPQGRIKAIISVPHADAEDILTRSGQHGVLYEITPNQGYEEDFARVQLPVDWTLQDCLAEVAALPQAERQKVLGLTLTNRAYAARVRIECEAELTRLLNSERARQLGPALGIRPDQQWILKGLPKRLAKQDLIDTLATPAVRWTPWLVIPKFAVSEGTMRGSSWVVDSEEPPPAKILRIRGMYATIERYIDTKRLQSNAKMWAKPIHQWDLYNKAANPCSVHQKGHKDTEQQENNEGRKPEDKEMRDAIT